MAQAEPQALRDIGVEPAGAGGGEGNDHRSRHHLGHRGDPEGAVLPEQAAFRGFPPGPGPPAAGRRGDEAAAGPEAGRGRTGLGRCWQEAGGGQGHRLTPVRPRTVTVF